MAKNKPTTDALEILRRRYGEPSPESLAEEAEERDVDGLIEFTQALEQRGFTVNVQPATTDDRRPCHRVEVTAGKRIILSTLTKAGVGA